MKKKILCTSICVMAIILAGCVQSIDVEAKRPVINENYYADYEAVYLGNSMDSTFVASLDYLEKWSEYIFTGYLLEEGKPDLQKIPDSDYVILGVTIHTLVVTDVIRGPLKKGDEIPYIEPYYVDDVSGKDTLYCIGNYSPSIPGKEYLFFTEKHDTDRYAGMYAPLGIEYGRYPMLMQNQKSSIDSLTNREMNIGTLDSTQYKKVLTDVVNKYGSYMTK